MQVVDLNVTELKEIINQAVSQAIRQEMFSVSETLLAEVSDNEMNDIVETHGKSPLDDDIVDVTHWFANEN